MLGAIPSAARHRWFASVDVMIDGHARVAVECKLIEWEVGSRSRPMTEDEDRRALEDARRALKNASCLRRVSWQRILTVLDRSSGMKWLSSEIRSKNRF